MKRPNIEDFKFYYPDGNLGTYKDDYINALNAYVTFLEAEKLNADKTPVKNLLPERDKLLDEAYNNVHCDSDVNYDTVAMADFDSNILDYVLDKIYNVDGNCA